MVWYHLRRTTATLAIHGGLLLVFACAMAVYYPEYVSEQAVASGAPLRARAVLLLWAAAVVGGLSCVALALWWRRGSFERHPIARMLRTYHESWVLAKASDSSSLLILFL